MSLLDILSFHSDTTKKLHLDVIKIRTLREQVEQCRGILKHHDKMLNLIDEQILETIETIAKIELEEDIPLNLHISDSHIILETIKYRHCYDNCKNAAIDVFKILKNEYPDISQDENVERDAAAEYETINREQLLEMIDSYKDIKDNLRKKSLFIQVFFEEVYLMFYISQYQI